MSGFIEWLKQQGENLVSFATSGVAQTVRDFGARCVEYEMAYRAVYLAWHECQKAGIAFEYQEQFMDYADAVEKERKYRLLILKAFYLAGANPAEYGITVHGLTEQEVLAVYPGLNYDPQILRALDAVPQALALKAAVVLALATLVGLMLSYMAEIKRMDLKGQLAAAYVAQGMDPETAFRKASQEIDEQNKSVADKAFSALRLLSLATLAAAALK